MSINYAKILSTTSKQLEQDEGFRSKPYQDHLGHWTIGHGFTSLRENESRLVLQMKIMRIVSILNRRVKWFEDADPVVQQVLAEMCFQVGLFGLLGFKKTLRYLSEKQYNQAADEMLDSLWARQTPNRAKRASDRIRNLG